MFDQSSGKLMVYTEPTYNCCPGYTTPNHVDLTIENITNLTTCVVQQKYFYPYTVYGGIQLRDMVDLVGPYRLDIRGDSCDWYKEFEGEFGYLDKWVGPTVCSGDPDVSRKLTKLCMRHLSAYAEGDDNIWFETDEGDMIYILKYDWETAYNDEWGNNDFPWGQCAQVDSHSLTMIDTLGGQTYPLSHASNPWTATIDVTLTWKVDEVF